MPKRGEKTWTQRVVEYGPRLMERLAAKQAQLGYNSFAEFARHIAVDYLQRNGDAPATAPAADDEPKKAAAG